MCLFSREVGRSPPVDGLQHQVSQEYSTVLISTPHPRRLHRSSRSETFHPSSTNRSRIQPLRRVGPGQSEDVLKQPRKNRTSGSLHPVTRQEKKRTQHAS